MSHQAHELAALQGARAERAEAQLRAAESIAAQVLGARFDCGTGIVTLSGVTNGLSSTMPDA